MYFVGIFGPLYNTWENDLYYSSRYTMVDHFHRVFEILRFLFVTSMVLHTKTLDLLEDPNSVETFALMISILAESLMTLYLNIELVLYADGDRKAIVNHTSRKLKYQFIPFTLVYAAAAAVSGYLYLSKSSSASSTEYGYGEDKAYDSGYDTNSAYPDGLYTNETDASAYGDYSDRFLATATESSYSEEYTKESWDLADVPYILCCSAYVLNIAITAIRKLFISSDDSRDIREDFVPNNIDYLIHR